MSTYSNDNRFDISNNQNIIKTLDTYNSKNSSFNGLWIGRYGQQLDGDPNPYNIYSMDI